MKDTKLKFIYSKDAAKIAVITLLKGVKCKTAVVNAENGNLEFRSALSI